MSTTFRSRFSDEQRVEFVSMDLKGSPLEEMKKRFDCTEYSIYQGRRSSWYQLLIVALIPHVGDHRASQIGASVQTNNKIESMKKDGKDEVAV